VTPKTKRKALGQHFLKSRTVLKRIIRCISPQGQDLIIEIGAGKGALTFPLAEKAGRVIAIEKDPSLIPFLERRSFPNLTILEKDVLRVDFRELARKENIWGSVKLVGNLPYSLSSPLLQKVLEERELISECVFLLQKEMAERLSGQPGSKSYAPLSILFQNHFFIKLHFTVGPGSFSPPPKVHSALISLRKRSQPLFFIDNEELFRVFLRACFTHRRKILLKNLEKLDVPLSAIEKAYQKFSMERNIRSEQIPLSRFVELFRFLFINVL